jgi:antitoxin component YwqK of YwqJK toxin-antitoxin module
MFTRFEQGKFHGPSFELYSNGLKKWEDFWRNGELNGPYTWWYEDGKKKLQGVREDGLTDGKLTRWYANGRVKWEQTYENDRLNGPFTTWYRSGRKKCDAIYRDNQWTSFVLWCPNGDMAWNESRWEGNQDGSYVPWVDEEGIETLEDFFRTDPKIVEDESPIDFERKDPEKEGEVEADLLLP